MNFKEYLVKKGIKMSNSADTARVKTMLVGKRIKILNADHGQDYGKVGTILEIGKKVIVNSGSIGCGKVDGNGNNLNYDQFEFLSAIGTIADIAERKAELETIIKESQTEIEVLDMKSAHMEENGIEELSDEEWKIYEMLLTLKTTSRNDMQKAKAIAELLISA